MRSKSPECYWLVMRYFTVRQLTVRLHEDLHPHPKFEMWVDVKTADGVHLTNVQVHAMWCVGWSVGVVLCCDEACVWWLAGVRGRCACLWRADREADHDASCALVLTGFKLAMGYPEWRPFEIIAPDGRALTGRHLVRTAMQFMPRSALGRRVRARLS